MELPTDVDLLVLGTGLQEALLAAAASKAGKSVLHLDTNPFYGSGEATLDLPAFIDLVQKGSASDSTIPSAPATPGRDAMAVDGHAEMLSDTSCMITDTTLQHAHGYSIDLWPQIAYCCDPIIEVLLHCQAQHYLEFKLLQASCVWEQGRLSPVPASRKEVFEHGMPVGDKRALWRFLKGTSQALEGQGSLQAAFGEAPFSQLLQQQGLPASVCCALTYAVAMADAQQAPGPRSSAAAPQMHQQPARPSAAAPAPSQQQRQQQRHSASPHAPSPAAAHQDVDPRPAQPPAGSGSEPAQSPEAAAGPRGDVSLASAHPGILTGAQALQRMALYMRSAGRYGGSGAFLLPMYGASELAQAFCRVAAVHGAVYALRQNVAELLLDPSAQQCTGVRLSTGQEVRCRALAGTPSMLPRALYQTSEKSGFARAVLVTDASLHPDHQHFGITVPPGNHLAAVRLLQLSSVTSAAPSGRFVVHLTTPSLGQSPSDVLAPVISTLFSGSDSSTPLTATPDINTTDHPHILFQAFWTQPGQVTESAPSISNIAICQPPSSVVGFGSALEGARGLYSRLYPGEDLFGLSSADAGLGDDSDEEAADALEAALAGLPDA